MISLTDFFAAASWRHNDVTLLPAIRRVSGNDYVSAGQCTDTPRCASATVELLRQETTNFLSSNRGLQTAQISVLRITRSELSCSVVSITKKSIVWMNWNGSSSMSGCGLEQSIFDEAIDQWQGRHIACVHAKGGHFEYSLWTDNVDFVHICYIQCDLFDC